MEAMASRRRAPNPAQISQREDCSGESAVPAFEGGTDQLRAEGRVLLGITGVPPALASADVVRARGWRNLFRLSALVAVDGARVTALTVVAAQIGASLGIAAISLLITAAVYISAIAALGLGAPIARRWSQAQLAILAGVLSSLTFLGTAFVTNVWWFLPLSVASGLAGGVVIAMHRPLIMESFPPQLRIRAMSFHVGAQGVGIALTALFALVLSAAALSWRTLMILLAFVSVVATIISRGLSDSEPGGYDTGRIEELVRQSVGSGDTAPELQDSVMRISVFGGLREVINVMSARSALSLAALFGLVLWPMASGLNVFFESRWAMGWTGRTGFLLGLTLIGVVSVLLAAPIGEKAYAVAPWRLLVFGGLMAVLSGVALILALSVHLFAFVVLFLAVSYGGLFVVLPSAAVLLLSLVRPQLRSHASIAIGIAIIAGGVVGQLLLGSIESRFGIVWAFFILSLAMIGIGVDCMRAKSRSGVEPDVARLVGTVVELEELRCRSSLGQHMPLLSCRQIDFSYGQVQVLFEVDFTVDDGELVALLGTNGAGKSTLLKVISGVILPSGGLVHYRGASINSLDPEQRVKLGISQIPGGRAVFGELSVAENLRMYGFAYRKDRRLVEEGIETTFEMFPRLAERRNQLASTLSGGEQQMLGLGKAFIQKPRVLLVDELSLGLAPKVVGELMDMVRKINEAGTAIVVVEQSVNVALSLARHAYFMEKGEIRFDGDAQALLERPDLLRAVFLGGAASGMSTEVRR